MKICLKNRKKILAAIAALLAAHILLRIAPFLEFSEFCARPNSTTVCDRKGEVLQILPLENGLRREWLDADEIPQNVRKIFVSAEDRRFYFHFGIDAISVARSFFGTRSKSGRGVSTIEMQLARMASPCDTRTFFGAAKNLLDALKIGARLGKRQILTLYLNSVPFGKNIEGVSCAAKFFFGKSLAELSDEQIACLAAIPRNPAKYNPLDNCENCAKAAWQILKKSDFSQILAAAKSAKKSPFPFEAPHFVRHLQNSQKERIERGGKVKTSLDLSLQNFAEKALSHSLLQAKNSRINNAALLACDVSTGEILCWIGSQNWNDNENGGQIDGVLRKIQPGSSMKSILYACALDAGAISSTEVLADVPAEFGGESLYIPRNFNNRWNGAVRARVALASSLNMPAVKVLQRLTVREYLERLAALGFSLSQEDAERLGLSLALGAAEVPLAALVPAFATIARDGIFLPLSSDGKKEGRRVFSADSARVICSFLSDKAARATGFGYSQSFQTDFPAIFKTGTANQYQSIVALGATKNFAVGVWMGNFSGNTVIGKTGSSLPAQIAAQVLAYLENSPEFPSEKNAEFGSPEGYEWKKICALSGKSPSQFCPSTVCEWVKGELPACDWHSDGKTAYPAEYQGWILQSGKDAQIDYSSAKLQIVSPANGSVFFYDDTKRQISQIVRLEATGGISKTLDVFYDGKFFATLSRPFVCDIPCEKGRHSVKISALGFEQSAEWTVK